MDRCSCTPEQCQGCPDRVICRCLQVTEAVLVEALHTLEIRSVSDIRRATGAGDGCTACHKRLRKYLEEHSVALRAGALAGRLQPEHIAAAG